jgi:tRNA/rRNA methyltransferase
MGENIGAAARAMANFGLSELRLVAPRDGWPNEAASANAAHATEVVKAAKLYDTTEEAVADLNHVYAATARRRDMEKPEYLPEDCAALVQEQISAGQQVGILFGAERSGLENADVTRADAIVYIPTDDACPSMNLAQAVVVLSYALAAKQGESPRPDREKQEPLATKEEVEAMLSHMEEELEAKGHYKAEKMKEKMQHNVRNLFFRAQPKQQEIRSLRGIIKALVAQNKD